MLVLSRKTNQRILIGSSIEIVITQVRGNTVRLGINAPLDISVHREEVQHRIEKEERRHRSVDRICNSI